MFLGLSLKLSPWERNLCVSSVCVCVCVCVCLSPGPTVLSSLPNLSPRPGRGQYYPYFYIVCVCARAHPFSHSVMSDSLRSHGLTVPHQSPLSIASSREEYWIGLPFPTPRDLPKPGMEAASLVSSALAGKFFTTVPPGKPISLLYLPLM